MTTTGLVDPNFLANTAGVIVNKVVVQPDDQILLGGNFTTVSGTARNHIARLTATGLVDPIFNPNMGAMVNDIVVQPDGNILV